ncbi:MAG: hypothetical protein L3J63_05755 [Geopsychrobacter sp.]|nr:hypothetical protein [Geopsychrobacter sp.]
MSEDFELLRVLSPQVYFKNLSEQYHIDVELLKSLDRDFILVPRGKYAPNEDDPLPGTLPQIAVQIGLSINAILDLQQRGAVSNPIIYGDLDFIRRFKKTTDGVGTTNLSGYKAHKILPRSLDNAWGRFIYRRYLNNNIRYFPSGKMINPKDRIIVRKLAREVALKYNIPNDKMLWDAIEKIREIVQNKKRAED